MAEAKVKEAAAPLETEIIDHGSLVKVGAVTMADVRQEVSLIERLSRLEDGAAVLARRAELIGQVRHAAIRATDPQHWVLFKDKEGTINALLSAPGADLVAQIYGIRIFNIGPTRNGEWDPKKTTGPNGEVSYEGWCDASSAVTTQTLEHLHAMRSSSESFVGRGGVSSTTELVSLSDLRHSVYRLLFSKAVRILAGMARVPLRDLDAAWDGTTKASVDCRKGSGFGTSTERNASRVADEGVAAAAAALAKEILAAVNGDENDARQVMKEITANPDKGFKGFDSAKRLTKDWQVEAANKRWREHPLWGGDGGGGE